MTGCFTVSCSVVSIELTGGLRTIHDSGSREKQAYYDIAVVGASGDLNCLTSGKYCYKYYFAPVII